MMTMRVVVGAAWKKGNDDGRVMMALEKSEQYACYLIFSSTDVDNVLSSPPYYHQSPVDEF